MKVEQLNNVQIDWTKPQVVVNDSGEKVQIATNTKTDEGYFCGVDINTGVYATRWWKDNFKPENATQYPIDLKLTIESDEELCDLLHVLALNTHVVNDNTKISLKHKASLKNYPLFDLIDDLAKERNLYKND